MADGNQHLLLGVRRMCLPDCCCSAQQCEELLMSTIGEGKKMSFKPFQPAASWSVIVCHSN